MHHSSRTDAGVRSGARVAVQLSERSSRRGCPRGSRVASQVTLDNHADRSTKIDGDDHETATHQLPTVGYWPTVVTTGAGNQGSIPESRLEKRPPLSRLPAGAQICQCSIERTSQDLWAGGTRRVSATSLSRARGTRRRPPEGKSGASSRGNSSSGSSRDHC